MTSRQLYEAVLIELNKELAPNLLLEDFNYLANKAIYLYINKRYNIYDINLQTTDDVRVLKATALLDVEKAYNKYDNDEDLFGFLGATYEAILPSDYFHLLNCVCIYKVHKTFKCYNKGDSWRRTATRLTSDAYSQVLDNWYLRPTYRRPYYYIHNVNKFQENPTNPYLDDETSPNFKWKGGTDLKDVDYNIPSSKYTIIEPLVIFDDTNLPTTPNYVGEIIDDTYSHYTTLPVLGEHILFSSDNILFKSRLDTSGPGHLYVWELITPTENLYFLSITGDIKGARKYSGELWIIPTDIFKVDNNYYNSLGEDVTSRVYTKENNKFYDSEGNEVTGNNTLIKYNSKYYNLDTTEFTDLDGHGTPIVNSDSINLFEKFKFKNGDNRESIDISPVEKAAKVRYGNASDVRIEIRYGADDSLFELKKVYIDYLKTPQNIRLTLTQLDLTEDTSQILEFPDYVCQEIVNELVHIIMENISDLRILTHPVVSQSIANPAQQLTPQTAE